MFSSSVYPCKSVLYVITSAATFFDNSSASTVLPCLDKPFITALYVTTLGLISLLSISSNRLNTLLKSPLFPNPSIKITNTYSSISIPNSFMLSKTTNASSTLPFLQ
ncbi:hypothetical protein V8G54_006027 [Vigna mungo]|uniref:Uncharacterized protein n=1 Tax=Vigna mungo TaxID=3915 RepID=A0AAQ3NZ69_VIGMU